MNQINRLQGLKMLAVLVLAVCVASLLIPDRPAHAAAMKIAYIDVGEVVDNHPKMKDITRQVAQFRRNKIDEVKKKFGDSNEKVDLKSAEGQRMVEETALAMQEVEQYKAGLIEELIVDIRSAAKRLGKEAGVDIIIAREVVMYGGLDLTPAMNIEMNRLYQ